MFRKSLLGALALLAAAMCGAPAMAQTYHDYSGTIVSGFVPLVGCDSGGACTGPVTSSNPLPISGTFSATLSGFAPGASYASLSASSSSSNVALPTGATVVVYNTGSVAAYVKLGGSSVTATTGADVVPAGGWMAFTVGANTYLAAITASGSTTLNLSGGSGLATGAGGGGSGGTVAQGSPNTAANAWPMSVTDYAGVNQVGVNSSHQIAIQAPPSLPLPSGAATAANQMNGSQETQVVGPTGTAATVKAASTPAAQTDTSLVERNPDLGTPGDAACSSDTGSCDINALMQRVAQRLSSLIAALNSPFQAGGSIGNTAFAATSSAALTNPTSTLTLAGSTSAYAAGQLIANNATAASVATPSFAIANSGGGALIPRLRLATNDTTSTAWGGVSIQVDLWSAAPTWANGDRGTWSPATGTGSHLGSYSCTMSAEYGDGAYAECSPNVGSASLPKLSSGQAIYWSLQAVSASGVTGASKTFTLTAEVLN